MFPASSSMASPKRPCHPTRLKAALDACENVPELAQDVTPEGVRMWELFTVCTGVTLRAELGPGR